MRWQGFFAVACAAMIAVFVGCAGSGGTGGTSPTTGTTGGTGSTGGTGGTPPAPVAPPSFLTLGFSATEEAALRGLDTALAGAQGTGAGPAAALLGTNGERLADLGDLIGRLNQILADANAAAPATGLTWSFTSSGTSYSVRITQAGTNNYAFDLLANGAALATGSITRTTRDGIGTWEMRVNYNEVGIATFSAILWYLDDQSQEGFITSNLAGTNYSAQWITDGFGSGFTLTQGNQPDAPTLLLETAIAANGGGSFDLYCGASFELAGVGVFEPNFATGDGNVIPGTPCTLGLTDTAPFFW